METRNRAYRILATTGVFHQAIRGTESLPLIPGSTYFRIWKTPLIAESFVGHGFPAFSKLRRSGWRQRMPEPKRSAYSQASGFSTRQSEKSRVSPRYLVRHISGSGRCRCLLTVSSVMTDLPSRSFGGQDDDKRRQGQNSTHTCRRPDPSPDIPKR
jgi:hypothetical protein